ncbi:MAG: DNA polymerase III subunit chi [Alphaproteobacteria bacterium]|nr:DNA polymerase III subunit chi [Alphaproteobacteria bacterium]MDE2110314.1 DNA polymerase III subunit chi [Alphaproteobacteria bacterium]MDE2494853.1 DNA polymerase III subunit chi [Alphaproteobacteria bacterium]
MTETLFYHLERRSLDDVLPGLIEKTLERGWRALIRADTAERADAIDTRLWTYSEQTFLPHAQLGDGDPARQPVLITVEEGNPNRANVLFLIGGAAPPAWDDAGTKELTRIVLMFDGRDPAAVENARGAWKNAKAAGHDVTYWKESPTGKWEKQG